MASSAPSSPGRPPRIGAGVVILAAVATFVVGAYIGSDGALGGKLLRALAALGAPQYEAYQEMYAERAGAGTADYLLFFEKAHRAQSEGYFEAHPEVRIVDKTIFDNAVVVAIPEPVGPWLEDLRAQPFVWMLVRDRPFFFCH